MRRIRQLSGGQLPRRTGPALQCRRAGRAFQPSVPGRRPRLTDEEPRDPATIVETGPDPATDGGCAGAGSAFAPWSSGASVSGWRSMGAILHRLGFTRLSARPRHPQSPPEARAVSKNVTDPVRAGLPQTAKGKPLEIWFQEWAGSENGPEDRFPGERKGRSAGPPHAPPGPQRHPPAGTERLSPHLGLPFRCRLPGARHRRGARHAACDHRGDDRPSRRNQPAPSRPVPMPSSVGLEPSPIGLEPMAPRWATAAMDDRSRRGRLAHLQKPDRPGHPHLDAAAAIEPRPRPCRTPLATSPPEHPREPGLRQLGRHRRRLLHRVEQPHGQAAASRLHNPTTMGAGQRLMPLV